MVHTLPKKAWIRLPRTRSHSKLSADEERGWVLHSAFCTNKVTKKGHHRLPGSTYLPRSCPDGTKMRARAETEKGLDGREGCPWQLPLPLPLPLHYTSMCVPPAAFFFLFYFVVLHCYYSCFTGLGLLLLLRRAPRSVLGESSDQRSQ